MAPGALVHGLTLGEMARLANARPRPARLTVVEMSGWSRSMSWNDTGRPWVPPSPNLRTAEAALVYPGTCLLEAVNVSEGRGTDAPFLLFGAPWLRTDPLAAALKVPGLRLEPETFVPTPSPAAREPRHAGERCRGFRVHVTDGGLCAPTPSASRCCAPSAPPSPRSAGRARERGSTPSSAPGPCGAAWSGAIPSRRSWPSTVRVSRAFDASESRCSSTEVRALRLAGVEDMTSPGVHVLVFDGLADWETGHALAELRRSGGLAVVAVGFTAEAVTTMGGLRIRPDLALSAVVPGDVRLFLLPGGDMWEGEYPSAALEALLRTLTEKGIPIAAICGATLALARAGLLDERRHTSNAPEYVAEHAANYQGAASMFPSLRSAIAASSPPVASAVSSSPARSSRSSGSLPRPTARCGSRCSSMARCHRRPSQGRRG